MNTITEFYRELILTLPKKALKKRNFDDITISGEVKIERDLFGWKLYTGKNMIECRSEEEARYIKIFLEAEVTKFYVPKDDEYLKKVLPQLEDVKAWIDEVLNDYLEGILDRRIREQLKSEVYQEVAKVEAD